VEQKISTGGGASGSERMECGNRTSWPNCTCAYLCFLYLYVLCPAVYYNDRRFKERDVDVRQRLLPSCHTRHQSSLWISMYSSCSGKVCGHRWRLGMWIRTSRTPFVAFPVKLSISAVMSVLKDGCFGSS